MNFFDDYINDCTDYSMITPIIIVNWGDLFSICRNIFKYKQM